MNSMNRLVRSAAAFAFTVLRACVPALSALVCAAAALGLAAATHAAAPTPPKTPQVATPPDRAASKPEPQALVTVPTYFEQGDLARSGEKIQGLGPDLMGDRIGEFTGALAFNHTDVSIPGNSALPVQIARKLEVGTKRSTLGLGLFGDWDLDVPHLSAIAFESNPDWYGGGPGNYNTNRCSQLTAPPVVGYSSGRTVRYVQPYSWFGGYKLSVPGAGDQTLLRRTSPTGTGPSNPIAPTDGNSYPVITKQHWQLSCLQTLARGNGEGFIALAPDGTRYRFDHIVQRA